MEAQHGGVALVFARKRKAPPPEAASPAPSARTQRGAAAASTHTRRTSQLRTPAAQRALTAAATAVAAESPYADEVEMPQPLGERLLEGLTALPERAPPADRLRAFCASLCAATVEAAAAAPAHAAALADALDDFQRSLAAALEDGGVALAALPRPPSTPADEDEVEQQAPGYRVDLEARKAGLRARLAHFQKVHSRRGCQQGTRILSVMQHLHAFPVMHTCVAELEDEELAEAAMPAWRLPLRMWPPSMHRSSPCCLQEEAEWHSLLQKVQELDQQQLTLTPDDPAPGSGDEAAAGGAAARSEADLSSAATEPGVYGQPADHAAQRSSSEEQEGDAALAALEAAHAGIHRHLAMQVSTRVAGRQGLTSGGALHRGPLCRALGRLAGNASLRLPLGRTACRVASLLTHAQPAHLHLTCPSAYLSARPACLCGAG